MKIIFLDFDGPLSNDRTQAQTGDWYSFDPVACQALDTLCSYSGAKIVVSSTRAFKNPSSFRETSKLMSDAGLDPKHMHGDWCIRDKNQWSRKGRQHKRGTLIRRWLAAHPEVTHYAIIDDENVFLPNFVKVSENDGILSAHFRKIAALLEIDLGDAFQHARERRGEFHETQYNLPFNQFYINWNESISSLSSQHPS